MYSYSPPPEQLHQQKNTSSPDSLFTTDLLPCLLYKNSLVNRTKEARVKTKNTNQHILLVPGPESTNPEDFFTVELDENIQNLEKLGCHNSLFLAVSRALLFKINYEDQDLAENLRNVCFSNIDGISSFCFNSDMALQELIRKALCLYWLKVAKRNYLNLSKSK